MALIDNNNQFVKLFVRVPATVANFDGATVSTGSSKLYFDEANKILWVKGIPYSLSADDRAALATLIGSDTGKSARTIAQEVVNGIMDWQSADANAVIDTLKEVLTWFNNLPEGDAGALALVNSVGKPSVKYTAEEIAAAQEGDDAYGKTTNDIKTPATGLYAQIETAVAGGLNSAGAKSGEVLIDAAVVDNKVEVESTVKLKNAVSAAETSIQTVNIAGVTASITGDANAKAAAIAKSDLQSALFTNSHQNSDLSYSYLGVTITAREANGELTKLEVDPSGLENRVSYLEAYDPWEEYSAS